MGNSSPALDGVDHRLTTMEMARFVVDGYLRFDAIVPAELNERVLTELPAIEQSKIEPFLDPTIPARNSPTTGTPLSQCRTGTALGDMLALPRVRGIIESLVGPEPAFDHDFVHHLHPGHTDAQHLHPDAIVDTADPAFDVQLFYFPHDVGPGEGGTRFVPGTHLRRATAMDTARYQHVVGDQRFVGSAGSVLVFHHGLWHAGDANPSAQHRWMYKIRLNPRVPQVRLWNTDDLAERQNLPTDHMFATTRIGTVATELRRDHPWQSEVPKRYDLVERVRLWRHLSDDPTFDVDHYLSRLDRPLASAPTTNDPAGAPHGGS